MNVYTLSFFPLVQAVNFALMVDGCSYLAPLKQRLLDGQIYAMPPHHPSYFWINNEGRVTLAPR